MKIDIEFIDNKGFLHFKVGKSKKAVLEFIKKLRGGTAINWLSKNKVHISQQYCKK